MNNETRIIYEYGRIYSFVKDITRTCERYNYDYAAIVEDYLSKHAVNMCLVQIGEHAGRIRNIDFSLYKDENLHFSQIKVLRDRITHSYGNIDYSLIKGILKEDIPALKSYLEKQVVQEVLDNPYLLYEQEYEDYLKSMSPQKNDEKDSSKQKSEDDEDDPPGGGGAKNPNATSKPLPPRGPKGTK